MRFSRTMLAALACAAAGLLGAGAHAPPRSAELPWHDARQLVLVTTADWDADRGMLRVYERVERAAWNEVDAFPVARLRPDAKPVFVLLPWPEYRRLQPAWQLPPLARP